ncbi:hypothetical protein BaRGS_00010091, partial [Batillaria attramentaria]
MYNIPSQVDDPGTTYAAAFTETMVLMKNEAWVVRRPYELSGALISSNASVGVLAGAQWTTYSTTSGAVNEQLPPVTALGKDHVTLAGGMVRVVATEPQTTVHFSEADPVKLRKPGQWYQRSVDTANAVYIRSDRPVAVVQVASGNYPVVVVIQPNRQFLDIRTTTVVPHLLLQTQALHIIAKASKLDNIRYDGILASTFPSKPALNTVFKVAYRAKTGTTPSQLVSDTGLDDAMAVYVTGTSATSAFLAPLAAQYETINPLRDCASTTNAEAGDTVDNDCDGMVDEDDCSTAGIDCRQTVSDGVKDVWGTEFAMPIPEHLGSLAQVNFTLAVTTVSTASVTVDFTKPGDPTESHSVTAATPYSLQFPASPSHALVGDRSSRFVRVTSTEEVSFTFQLYGVVGAGGAGGAMRVLPLDALGNEYYIVTVCMDLVCHFQVLGVYSNTELDVYLRLDPPDTSTVTFEGVTYTHGDVIHTTVQTDEGLQFKGTAGCDLTGTLVSASKPVAVFSISEFVDVSAMNLDKDHLLEQMPPVTSYGVEFFIKHAPERIEQTASLCQNSVFCDDEVFVVASQPNTTLQLANGEGLGTESVVEHLITSAGECHRFLLNKTSAQLVSDKPVLVVQVLKNLPSNFKAGMLVVNPWAQYSDRDVYAFQQQALNSDKVLVVYAVGEPAPAVTVDGTGRSYTTHVAGPLLNASYFTVTYNSAANSFCDVKTAGGSFGGFVDTLGFKEDITSLAFVLESNQLECLITKPVRGDGVDNDCDGAVDEEPCLIAEERDTDGDERFNEDCEALPEVTTQSDTTVSWSTEEFSTYTYDALSSSYDDNFVFEWFPGPLPVASSSMTSPVSASSHVTTSWSCITDHVTSSFSVSPAPSPSLVTSWS